MVNLSQLVFKNIDAHSLVQPSGDSLKMAKITSVLLMVNPTHSILLLNGGIQMLFLKVVVFL
jgi:hypothetical protein